MKNDEQSHLEADKKRTFITKKDFQEKIQPELIRLIAVIGFTFIYGMGLAWFIEASEIRMYGGGIPGIAQLLVDFFNLMGVHIEENLFKFIAILAINIPIFFLAWFGISKKFAIYSAISAVIQATVIGFIRWDVLKGVDPLLLSIFGGILIGFGVGGALRFGTSTGGFDIISQWLSLKRGKSVGQISTIINVVVTILGSICIGFSDQTVDYGTAHLEGAKLALMVISLTVLRLIVTMIVMDKVHTSYNYIEFNIITEVPEEMAQEIIKEMQRGVTIFDARGGYAFKEKSMLFLVVMSFEKHRLLRIVQKFDPHAFIVSKPVKTIHGNFSKKRVA